MYLKSENYKESPTDFFNWKKSNNEFHEHNMYLFFPFYFFEVERLLTSYGNIVKKKHHHWSENSLEI